MINGEVSSMVFYTWSSAYWPNGRVFVLSLDLLCSDDILVCKSFRAVMVITEIVRTEVTIKAKG